MIKVFGAGSYHDCITKINKYLEDESDIIIEWKGFSPDGRMGGGGVFIFEINENKAISKNAIGELISVEGSFHQPEIYEGKINDKINEGWHFYQIIPPYGVLMWRSRMEKSIDIAKRLGFKNPREYDVARDFNFDVPKDFRLYIQSIQKIDQEFQPKYDSILTDAQTAKKQDKFSEFIRLSYLALEYNIKTLQEMRLELIESEEEEEIDQEIDEDDEDDDEDTEDEDEYEDEPLGKLDTILINLNLELGLKLSGVEEISEWRGLRNKIVHDYLQVDKKIAIKFEDFAQRVILPLYKYSSKTINEQIKEFENI